MLESIRYRLTHRFYVADFYDKLVLYKGSKKQCTEMRAALYAGLEIVTYRKLPKVMRRKADKIGKRKQRDPEEDQEKD